MTDLQGAIGSGTTLASITTDADGTTQLNNNITTTGAQTFGDAVILTGNVIIDSESGEVQFNSTVDGQTIARNLEVISSGTVVFGDTLGASGRINNLKVTVPMTK